MKRLISCLLSVVLIISVLGGCGIQAVASTSSTITVSDVICNPGDEITLPVLLENNSSIMYLSVTPKCYQNQTQETDYLTISSVKNGELFSLEIGKNLVFDSDGDVTKSGKLCTLFVAVADDTPYGEYSVELILRECYDSSERDVDVQVVSSSITVKKPHVAGAEAIENEVKATCTKDGSYDKVVRCTECGEVLSREKIVTQKTGHSYKNVITKATVSKNGKIVKQCKSCGDKASTSTIYAASTVKLSKSEFTYTGQTIKPTVVVKDSKGKTISSDYYTLSGTKSAKNIGKFTIKVTFKERYSGSKTLSYTINPKTVSGLKLKSPAKKRLTVSWKKGTSVSGYEIMYATNSGFTKNKKTIKVTSYKTDQKTIKNLSSKKTYYVKIRAYKTVSGKKLYSSWSTVKKLKIK